MIIKLKRGTVFFFAALSSVPSLLRNGQASTTRYMAPTLLIPINSSAPTIESRGTSTFFVSKDAIRGSQIDCLVSFSIPEEAYGCQLEFSLPPTDAENIGNSSEIEIWSMNDTVDESCCWNGAPTQESLLGTAKLQPNNSMAAVCDCPCNTPVQFRVSMAARSIPGNISFDQQEEEGMMLRYTSE